jgi:hypothetical protein
VNVGRRAWERGRRVSFLGIHQSDFRYSAWNHNHGETQMLKLMVDVMIFAISADEQLKLTSTTAECSNFIKQALC